MDKLTCKTLSQFILIRLSSQHSLINGASFYLFSCEQRKHARKKDVIVSIKENDNYCSCIQFPLSCHLPLSEGR